MKLGFAAFVFAVAALAQGPVPIQPTAVIPSGNCPNPAMQYVLPSGDVYSCNAGTWAKVGGGGVTSIATTGPITGGTITGTGTISCATCGVTGSPLSQFAATTSAQLAGVLSDKTGTGVTVFATAPTLPTTLTIGTATTGGQATTLINGNVLGGASTTDNFLNVLGTLPAVTAQAANAVNWTITSAGSASFQQRIALMQLSAGYTGNSATQVIRATNSAAGTGVSSWTGGAANIGVDGLTPGVTVGHNIGIRGQGSGSSILNIGGIFISAISTSTPALNVGAAALALNATTNVGGFFGLMDTAPTLGTSAALIADNGATGSSILIARSNGNSVATITGSGTTIYDSTATAGVTNLTVTAGAGQAASSLVNFGAFNFGASGGIYTGTAAGVSGIVPIANGGTGTTTPGIVAGTNITVSGTWPNQTVNASSSGTVSSVGFTGGLISVATATTTPAFTVAGTSGGVPYFSSASTWASSAALAAGQFMLGGGAGASPTASFAIVPGVSGGTGVANTGSTITLGGNLATSGAFATTFTATATTTVTLPTTGTLATLAGVETFTNKTLTSPALTTPTVTTSEVLSNNGITSTAPGYTLQNTTAATVGVQEWSPAATWIAQGWKTTATAASQTVKWRAEVIPIQSSTGPNADLVFTPTQNGVDGATFHLCSLSATGTGAIMSLDGNACNSSYQFGAAAGFGPVNSGNIWGAFANNTGEIMNFGPNGTVYRNTTGVMFASGNPGNSQTGDVTLDRDAAGVIGIQSGAPGTTAANYRDLKLRHRLASGAAPTVASGFGTTPSIAGADGAMRVTVGTGGVATTGTLTFGTTWTTAPACTANDESAILLVQATAATTTVVITSATPWGAGALLTVICEGY